MNKKHTLNILYIVGFLFALRNALPSYINSSFLSSVTSEKLVGLIYTLESIFAFIFLAYFPKMVSKIGNYKMSIYLSIFNILSLLGLATFDTAWSVIFYFTLSATSLSLMYLSFDVFLERNSQDRSTGRIRAFYLTSLNLAWVLSPLISGLIVGATDYYKVFLLSAIIMIPVLLSFVFTMRKFDDPDYKALEFRRTAIQVVKNKDIRNILGANFLLHFFFSWMVIYIPIYLHEYLGFSWQQLGIVFTIMLLPFIIFQLPLGYFADRKIGEKEFLVLSFIIMAVTSAVLSFTTSTSILVWGALLFATRVGASICEVMSESYFFKNVDSKDTNLISLFRMTLPLSYIIGPLLATAFLYVVDIKNLFIILGVIMLLGVRFTYKIKDTR